MKLSFHKQAGGVLIPASDLEAHRMEKFKTGAVYEVDIKQQRNPAFHGKVFAFFNFCFEHWRGGNEFDNEAGQFNVFRNNLTVLAGYYDTFINLKGETRIEAKSLSFGSMDQETFEQCYQALISAAMKHLFSDADQATEDKLFSFF